MSVGGFNSARALSTANENPAKASRPYDRDRDGFVMGEGAGSLILESLETAKARGAKIYGELVGVGATATHTILQHPPGRQRRNECHENGTFHCRNQARRH